MPAWGLLTWVLTLLVLLVPESRVPELRALLLARLAPTQSWLALQPVLPWLLQASRRV